MDVDIIINEYTSPRENAELAALAEGYGVRAVWSASYSAGRNPFMALMYAADATRRIRLGPLAVSALEMHPLIMANALLTLNEVSNGRATIAVGGGGGVLASMGIKRRHIAKSMGECLEILKLATEKGALDYKGELFSASGYRPRQWADDPPPLLYAAAGQPRTIDVATRLAAGLMGSDLVPSMIRRVKQLAEEGLQRHGRAGEPFAISNFWAWHVKADRSASMREARRELILRGMLYPYYTEEVLSKEESDLVQANMRSFWRAYGDGSGDIAAVPEEIVNKLIDRITTAGDFNDIEREIEKLKGLQEAGLTQIALRVHDDPADAIRMIGEHVIPALR